MEDEKTSQLNKYYSESTPIGVDVEITDFVVISTEEKVENPKYSKNSLKRLKVLQKELVENKKVLKTEKKPNKNYLYFVIK